MPAEGDWDLRRVGGPWGRKWPECPTLVSGAGETEARKRNEGSQDRHGRELAPWGQWEPTV